MSAAVSYVSVPVDALVGEPKIDFDLYVQLNTKHVLYLRKGGTFDSGRLEKMREKNVRHLWILPQEEAHFRAMYERKLEQAYDPKSTASVHERASLIQSAQAAAAEAIMKAPRDAGVYMQGAAGAKKFTEWLLRDELAFKSLLAVQLPAASVASHGVSVAAIAVALAKQMGLGEAKDLHLLTLGCLLHDSGHYGCEEATGFGRTLRDLAAEAAKTFKAHPLTGVRATQELVHFDQHVIKIILEHEEHIDGSGFPKGLTEKQMHAYPVIASTANAFDHLMTFEKEAPAAAAKRMIVDKIGRHPLAHLNALKVLAQKLG